MGFKGGLLDYGLNKFEIRVKSLGINPEWSIDLTQ